LFPDLANVHFPGAIVYRRPGSDSEGVQNGVYKTPDAPAIPPVPTLLEQSEARYFIAPLPTSDSPTDPNATEPEPEAVSCIAAPESPADRHDPSEPEAMATRAKCCADRGELTEALHWCDKAIAADKLEPRFLYLRATIHQERGELSEAAASLKGAIYLHPGFLMAYFALGHLAWRQGKVKDATRFFGEVQRLLRDYPADQTLPESEGITAGSMAELIRFTCELEMVE
jgi:chemotaxis protein methyltransferase CheR